MKFAKIAAFLVLGIIPLFPLQSDFRISFSVYALAIILLPSFYAQIIQDLKNKNKITLLFLLFLVVCYMSTLFSIDIQSSTKAFFLFLSYFIIFTSSKRLFVSSKDYQILALILIADSLFLSAVSLYFTLILHYVNKDTIGTSFMWVYYGHNHLSSLLLFAVPASLGMLVLNSKVFYKKFLFIAATVFFIIMMYFTFSRGGVIALLLELILVLIFSKSILKPIKTAIIIVSFIMISLLINNLFSFSKEFGLKKNKSFNSPIRLVYYQQAIANGIKSPILGTGPNTYKLINHYNTPKKILKTDNVHNFFLQMFSDLGFLGLITSTGLISLVIYKSYIYQKNSLIGNLLWISLVGSTVNGMVDMDWSLLAIFLVFWMIAGFLNSKKLQKP